MKDAGDLPIAGVLPSILDALSARSCAVLVAPPGAGKTTLSPLALLDADWRGDGRILLLEPRRLAARAAAQRMAGLLGEKVGETVGYRVRLDSRIGPGTRIEVLTEGVFTRRVLDDPGLEGVAAVLFDEFHERSLDADLGLALARDVQKTLRPDLRLLVMSATLDAAQIAERLDGAAVLESRGRQHPVETHYLGRSPERRVEEAVALAVRRAIRETDGSVLAFLPGQAEIRRVERLLKDAALPDSVEVHPLYGALSAAEQDRAIAPAPAGRRKIVLASAIAESSLTIEGVSVVVDCGLARAPRYDPSTGLTRLVTVRLSRASADQRRGRAGRLGPGVCYRLWDEPEDRSLVPFARPEILECDLSGLALDLAQWGSRSTDGLLFLDAPPGGAFAEARRLLAELGALDGNGLLTAHGSAMARMPLPPRLSHMLLLAGAEGRADQAADLAALLVEQGLGGRDVDLDARLSHFARSGSARERDAHALARRWARLASPHTGAQSGRSPVGRDLARAYPDRIARRRGPVGEFLTVKGRAVYVDPAEPLAKSEWIVAVEIGAGERRDRVLAGAALDLDLAIEVGPQIEVGEEIRFDPQGRPQARRTRRMGAIVLEETPLGRPSPSALKAAMSDALSRRGPSGAFSAPGVRNLLARIALATGVEARTPAVLAGDADFLEALLEGLTGLHEVTEARICETLLEALSHGDRRALQTIAPETFVAPTGTRAAIDYAAEAGPTVEIRVQELFGLKEHPTVGVRRRPLVLSLLSPARRPVQITRDLPTFWRGSWAAVRSEMRGRYPKHPWPEDPASAPPTTRAKPRA